MSTPEPPKGPRIVRRWIFGELLVAAAIVVIALATQCGHGVAAAPPEPPAARVRIHGRVTASEPGPAIAGIVRVQRWIGDEKRVASTATLGAAGRYEATFDLDPPIGPGASARMRLFVIAPGWAPGRVWISIPKAGDYEQDVELGPGRITGRVVDAAGHEVAGIDVRAGAPSTLDAGFVETSSLYAQPDEGREGLVVRSVTDVEGRFELRGLGASEYRLFSASPRWWLKPSPVLVGDTGVVLTAVPAVAISGVVRDSRSKDPVEATVTLSLERATPEAKRPTAQREFTSITRDGRFGFILPAPPSGADERFTIGAQPGSPDYVESGLFGPFARDAVPSELDLPVERVGSGSLVLEATTPAGTAFTGPMRMIVWLEPRERRIRLTQTFGVRKQEVTPEGPGRFRIQVPADRDWHAAVLASPPDSNKEAFKTVTVNLPIRVRDHDEVVSRLVVRRFGRLRIRGTPNVLAYAVESLSGDNPYVVGLGRTEAPRDQTLDAVPEGRYRISFSEGSSKRTRDVEVSAGVETIVDLK